MFSIGGTEHKLESFREKGVWDDIGVGVFGLLCLVTCSGRYRYHFLTIGIEYHNMDKDSV